MKKITILIFCVIAMVANAQKRNSKSIENITSKSDLQPTEIYPDKDIENKAKKTTSSVKKKEMKNTIIKIIKAYQNEDENTLNSLVYKQYGLTFLYARGAFDNINKTSQISFKNPVPEYLPYGNELKTNYKIYEINLPTYSCDTQKWDKTTGIYIDIKTKETSFSSIAKNENEVTQQNIWSEEDIKLFEEIESHSHKVIVIGKNQETFIFYIAFIKDKWHLTAIDRFEVCSA